MNSNEADPWNGKIHVLSIQPESMAKKLMDGETVVCDPVLAAKNGFISDDDDEFHRRCTLWYDWMAGQLSSKTPRPDGSDESLMPLWAWARRSDENKSRDVPVADAGIEYENDGKTVKERYAVIGMEIDASRCLLSSFDDWCSCVLFNQMIPPDWFMRILYYDNAASGWSGVNDIVDEWLDKQWSYDKSDYSMVSSTWWRCLRSLEFLRLKPDEALVDDANAGFVCSIDEIVESSLRHESPSYEKMKVSDASSVETYVDGRKDGAEWLQGVVWEFRPEDVCKIWWSDSRRIYGSGKFLSWNHDSTIRWKR